MLLIVRTGGILAVVERSVRVIQDVVVQLNCQGIHGLSFDQVIAEAYRLMDDGSVELQYWWPKRDDIQWVLSTDVIVVRQKRSGARAVSDVELWGNLWYLLVVRTMLSLQAIRT